MRLAVACALHAAAATATCISCTDTPSDYMLTNMLSCDDWTWGVANGNFCSQCGACAQSCSANTQAGCDLWVSERYCQRSCADAGYYYQDSNGADITCCSPNELPTVAPAGSPPPPPPLSNTNLIMFISDDHDALDYGVYGNAYVHTPAVDWLASKGVRFTNAYTPMAMCGPSRSAMFTGRYPMKNGVYANHYPVYTDGGGPSITARLQEMGYDLHLVGKSHLKEASSEPMAGYDVPADAPTVFNFTAWTHIGDYGPDGAATPALITSTIDPLLAGSKNGGRPLAMVFASHLPHGPYTSQGSYDWNTLQPLPAGYDSLPSNRNNVRSPAEYENIRLENEQLQAVFDAVEAHNLWWRTLFIYTSDHGCSGKWTTYEAGLKVPFIVRWSGHVTQGSTSDALVSLVDVMPTFLEVASGSDPSYEMDLDGRSLVPVLHAPASAHHAYVFGVATKQNILNPDIFPSRSVRGERYKLTLNFNALERLQDNLAVQSSAVGAFIQRSAEKYSDVPYQQLYDLWNDPNELTNLAPQASSDAAVAATLQSMEDVLLTWMVEQNDFLSPSTMPLLIAPFQDVDQNNVKVGYYPDPSLLNTISASDYIEREHWLSAAAVPLPAICDQWRELMQISNNRNLVGNLILKTDQGEVIETLSSQHGEQCSDLNTDTRINSPQWACGKAYWHEETSSGGFLLYKCEWVDGVCQDMAPDDVSVCISQADDSTSDGEWWKAWGGAAAIGAGVGTVIAAGSKLAQRRGKKKKKASPPEWKTTTASTASTELKESSLPLKGAQDKVVSPPADRRTTSGASEPSGRAHQSRSSDLQAGQVSEEI